MTIHLIGMSDVGCGGEGEEADGVENANGLQLQMTR